MADRTPSTFPSSPTAADLATKFPNGRDVLLEGRSHYIPMESPELVVELI